MPNPVGTDALKDASVVPPVKRKLTHRVIGLVVHCAALSGAGRWQVDVLQGATAVSENPDHLTVTLAGLGAIP